MAARAIGSGTIAFGMVSIPVKLYTATSSSEAIRFNTLHAECSTRIKQQLHCPTCEAEVGRGDTIKGYEFAKGKFVTFTAEEIKRMDAESTGAIEINEFVPIDDVDPVYFEKAYYLGPEKGAARPYALLAEAMRQTRLCAVARFSYRGKDYLIMLRPVEEGIVLQQLRHAWEVRKFSDVPMQDADVRDSELDLAIKLIQQITHAQFKPDKYTDDVRERVLDLINRKVEGEEITATVPESPKAQVIDLMAALKASIGADSGESSAEDEDEPVEAKTTKKKASTRKGPKAAKKTTTKKKTAKKAEG